MWTSYCWKGWLMPECMNNSDEIVRYLRLSVDDEDLCLLVKLDPRSLQWRYWSYDCSSAGPSRQQKMSDWWARCYYRTACALLVTATALSLCAHFLGRVLIEKILHAGLFSSAAFHSKAGPTSPHLGQGSQYQSFRKADCVVAAGTQSETSSMAFETKGLSGLCYFSCLWSRPLNFRGRKQTSSNYYLQSFELSIRVCRRVNKLVKDASTEDRRCVSVSLQLTY